MTRRKDKFIRCPSCRKRHFARRDERVSFIYLETLFEGCQFTNKEGNTRFVACAEIPGLEELYAALRHYPIL